MLSPEVSGLIYTRAEDGKSPFGSSGGGIFNAGALTLKNSTISANSAAYGGGIYNEGGTLTVIDSTLSDNES